jgi:hypothetical protein
MRLTSTSSQNGIIIGAGIGVLAGTTIGADACPDAPLACATGGAAVWRGIGALVDWLHKGRTLLLSSADPVRRSWIDAETVIRIRVHGLRIPNPVAVLVEPAE